MLGSDYAVSSKVATARSNSPDQIMVTFRVDHIGQENVETAQLRLRPISGFTSEGIFLDTITLRITDNDGQ